MEKFRCSRCNVELPASDFYVSQSGKRDPRCRPCASAYKQEWARQSKKTCAHPDGCPKSSHGGKYCPMHARRLRDTGDLGPVESSRERRPAKCWIPGCPNPCRAKRLCASHLNQRKFGVLWPQISGVVVPCCACGQDFKSQYHPYSGKSIYCSKLCQNRAKSSAQAFSNLFRTKWCEQCETLMPIGARVDKRFCSKRCRHRWFYDNDERYAKAARARTRAYKLANLDRIKLYRESNRPYFAQRQRLRDKKLQDRAVCGMPTTAQLEARLGSVCRRCGAPEVTSDHRKPLDAGGLHILSNLAALCRSCNSAKNAQWPLSDEWLHLKPLVAGKLP